MKKLIFLVLLGMTACLPIPVFSQSVEPATVPVIQFTWIHFLMAFLAYALNVIIKLQKAKKRGQVLTLGYYINRNWMDHVISIISIVVLFILGNEVLSGLEWYGVSEKTLSVLSNASKILAFTFGYANYSIIKAFLGQFKKSEKAEG